LNIYTNIFPTLLFNWKKEHADKRASSRAVIRKEQVADLGVPQILHPATLRNKIFPTKILT